MSNCPDRGDCRAGSFAPSVLVGCGPAVPTTIPATPIALGGTGATTAQDALINLGITPGGQAIPTTYGASNNASGVTTVTPPLNGRVHSEVITFSGSAGARTIVLSIATASEGDKIFLQYLFPATSGIIVYVRSESEVGILLDTTTTDDSGDDAWISFTYTGSIWSESGGSYPY